MTTAAHDPYDELDEFLAGPEPDWDSEPEPPPDAHQADRLIARLARVRGQRARSRDAAEERMRQIVNWQAEREAIWIRQEAWLLRSLAAYHQGVIALRGERDNLTLDLPSGTLCSRMGQPHWDVDEDKVLEALVPEPVREKLAEAREAYLQAVSDVLVGNLGALAPCVRVTPPADGVELSTSGLKAAATLKDPADPKGKRVLARGVRPDGTPIDGITVEPAERTYDVRPRTAEVEPF